LSTVDTVQLRPRSREVACPRKPSVESARLELKWWTWAATVVRPGPPGCEAWTALSPPIVDVKPVLDHRVER